MQLQSIQTAQAGYITERRYGRKRVKTVLFEAFVGSNGSQLLTPLSKEKLEEIEHSRKVLRRPSVRVVEISPAVIVPPVERSSEGVVTILLRGNAQNTRQCGRSCLGMRKRVQLVHGFETREEVKQMQQTDRQYLRRRRFDEDTYYAKPVSWKSKRTTQYK